MSYVSRSDMARTQRLGASLTIRLPVDLRAALEAHAEATQTTTSALIRAALRNALDMNPIP